MIKTARIFYQIIYNYNHRNWDITYLEQVRKEIKQVRREIPRGINRLLIKRVGLDIHHDLRFYEKDCKAKIAEHKRKKELEERKYKLELKLIKVESAITGKRVEPWIPRNCYD